MGSGFLAAFASLAAPITARVLIALGFSVVTIGGVVASVGTVRALIMEHLGQAPLAALQLIGLGGGWTALGIIFGAMTFCTAYWSLTQATKIL